MGRKHVLHISRESLKGEPTKAARILNLYSSFYVGRHFQWSASSEADVLGVSDGFLKWLQWADVVHLHGKNPLSEEKHQDLGSLYEILEKKRTFFHIYDKEDYEFLDKVRFLNPAVSIYPNSKVTDQDEYSYLLPNPLLEEDLVKKPYIARDKLSLLATITRAHRDYKLAYSCFTSIKRQRNVYTRMLDDSLPLGKRTASLWASDLALDSLRPSSYSVYSLECLGAGIPVLIDLNPLTARRLLTLFGCSSEELPFYQVDRSSLIATVNTLSQSKSAKELGINSRDWVLSHMSPHRTTSHFEEMYSGV